jgi:hypothetical protein
MRVVARPPKITTTSASTMRCASTPRAFANTHAIARPHDAGQQFIRGLRAETHDETLITCRVYSPVSCARCARKTCFLWRALSCFPHISATSVAAMHRRSRARAHHQHLQRLRRRLAHRMLPLPPQRPPLLALPRTPQR